MLSYLRSNVVGDADMGLCASPRCAQLLLRIALSFATAFGAVHCTSTEPRDQSPFSDEQDDVAADDSAGASEGGLPRREDAGDERNRPTKDGESKQASTQTDAGMDPGNDAGEEPGGAEPGRKPVIVDTYVRLDIAPTTPFDMAKPDAHPFDAASPMGWQWYNIDGAKCRDGSQFGVYVHWGEDPEKLLVFFEGGGACANAGFCELNPKNVGEQFLTGGESAVASLFLLPTPQGPSGLGLFDLQNPNNPVRGWSQVWLPYCTGDVHSGSRTNVTIEGLDTPQNFYGAENAKKAIGRIAATFPDITRFVVSGSSAGGFGAGINFGYFQDTFRNAFGSAILDASPPFTNDFMPLCLQKRWRETWDLDAHYPSDCGEQCRDAQGGNVFQILDYWDAKYPSTNVALISGIYDEIIRLFWSLGNDDCASYPLDPVTLFVGTLGDTYPPDKFKMGLDQLRTKYQDSKKFSSYYMDGLPNATAHQCLFRDRVYEEAAGAGKPTIAAFLKQFLDGTMTHVGP